MEKIGKSNEQFKIEDTNESNGRPLKSLCCNKTLEYAQGGYGVEYEFDMETPYESSVVYIYETDDYYLVDIEWI